MVVIPKPGREIPKSVAKQSGNDCWLIFNSLAADGLRATGRAGMGRARKAAAHVMNKPVCLSQNRTTRWLPQFFSQSRKPSGLAQQAPAGVGCLCYKGGNNHV